jgi:copper type II ascorbate-dependent monooxygenase-like protein
MPHLASSRCCRVLVILLGACGGDDGGDGGGGGGGNPASVTLVSRTWTQPASSESYQCREIQATSDLLITGFQPMLPAGQFRMWVVTSSAPTNPTPGDFECALDTLAAPGNRLIYAAGLGTNDIDFPSGVGVRVRSGQYVTLILHLVNVQGTTLSGTSGVTARTTSQLSTEADMILGGTLSLNIQPSGSSIGTGDCVAPTGWNLVALLPMGNALATHHTVELVHGAATTLHDAIYDFNQQRFYLVNTTVAQGDTIRVTCSYTNPRNSVVHFGPLANDEVCFTGLYRTPAPATAENPISCLL